MVVRRKRPPKIIHPTLLSAKQRGTAHAKRIRNLQIGVRRRRRGGVPSAARIGGIRWQSTTG